MTKNWVSLTGDATFTYTASSSVGTVRAVNEDSFVADPPVFLVADGMGGHSRGDAASAAASAAFLERLGSSQPWTPEAVLDAIASGNERISGLGAEGSDIAGTTLTGVVLVVTGATQVEADETTVDLGVRADAIESRYRWMVINVGDSRVYHLDDGPLRQVTVDHSLVQELVEQGLITAAEAQVHPERNVITRALGVDGEPTPDVLLLPAEGEHTFLICSDGVSNVIGLDELESVLRSSDPDTDAADVIVALALESGSRDNVTAVVVSARVATHGSPEHGVEGFEETQPKGEVVS